MLPYQGLLLTVVTSFFLFGFVICSDPPIERFSVPQEQLQTPPPPLTWQDVINTGCKYNSHRGTYQLKGNCDITGVIIPGQFSSQIPEQNVVCCISALCKKTASNPTDAYSCMNMENREFCFGGVGELVPNLCPGLPNYVQCCTEAKEVAQSPEARRLMAIEMPDDPLTSYKPASGYDNPAVIHYDQLGNPIIFETKPEVFFVPN